MLGGLFFFSVGRSGSFQCRPIILRLLVPPLHPVQIVIKPCAPRCGIGAIYSSRKIFRCPGKKRPLAWLYYEDTVVLQKGGRV